MLCQNPSPWIIGTPNGLTDASLMHIVFSHANSFPVSTYRVLFAALKKRGYSVHALEKFGHDPRYPVTNNWPNLVMQLADFVKETIESSGHPVHLVGHSLGGFLSLMTAARHPELARSVLLLDAPLLGGWRATGLGVAKSTPLIGSITPGAVSRKRRNLWPSAEDAFEHFRHKKAFNNWQADVLRDYVNHAMHDENGQRALSFRRDIETAIYNTLPDNLEQLLKRHPLKCPAAFIGGIQSQENRQVSLGMTEKVTKGRMMMVDGSHLFPMEKPLVTAAMMDAALLNLKSLSA
jgi:pimeloyl-ACP methyl ester carboxylesterase